MEARHLRLAFAAELFKVLIAPIVMLAVGLGVFVYEAVWGHEQAFAMMGLGLAASGAGLGSDLLERFVK